MGPGIVIVSSLTHFPTAIKGSVDIISNMKSYRILAHKIGYKIKLYHFKYEIS